MKYALVAVLALCVGFLALLGLSIAIIIKRADELEAQIMHERATDRKTAVQYSVRWVRHGNVECFYRGVLIPLDADTLVIEGFDGPVIVNRADIISVVA